MRFPTDMAEDIISYPEYEEFIGKLGQFHEERRTSFRAGPILGGKKIDLYLLYKLVMERGGMDKVSEERRWRKIGEEFQLPETCTSSAYVLKDVYQKYLKDYEMGTSSINMSKNEESSNAIKANSPSSSLSPTVVPSVTRTTAAEPSESAICNVSKRRTIEDIDRRIKVKAEETFRQARRDLMYQPKTLLRDGQNKIRLALLSSLEAEVEWALHKLTALSYVCESDFALSDIPDLLDALMQLIDEFLWEHHDRQSYDPLYHRSVKQKGELIEASNMMSINEQDNISWRTRIDMSLLYESRNLLRRTQQIALILRNFAIMDINKKMIIQHAKTRLFLFKGALLEGTSDMEEIRVHCMDILECVASHYILSGSEDMVFETLIHYLNSKDYAKISIALHILLDLTAVGQNDEAFLGIVSYDTLWHTLYNLVILPDHDLKDMVDEILYRLSQLDESLQHHILVGHPLSLAFERSIEQRLTGLDLASLNSHTLLSSSPAMSIPPSSTVQLLSVSRTTEDSTQQESQLDSTLYIAREWLKRSFEEAPNFLVQYPRMYWAYVEAIQNQSYDPRKSTLDEKAFLPLIRSIFPDTALQCLVRQDRPNYFISGIRVHQQKTEKHTH